MYRLLFLLFPIILFTQNTIETTNNINLKNNESINLSDYFGFGEEFNPSLVLNHNLLYDSVIQSFRTDYHNFSIIDKYLHHAHEKVGFGYKNILDGEVSSWGSPIPIFTHNQVNYVHAFQEYFHSLFQNKLARKLMFSAALNILENMCKNYPTDFRYRVEKEIDNLIEYVKIQNYYTSRKPANWDDNYWKGFIYRRVEQDSVPLFEIESCLLETKKMLNQVESEFIEYKQVLNVNGLKVFLIDPETIIFQKITTDDPQANAPNEMDYNIKSYKNISLKYLKDSDSEYYLIELGGVRHLYNWRFVRIN